MLSSRTTPKISVNVAIEFTAVESDESYFYVRNYSKHTTWKFAHLYAGWVGLESQLIGPSFDLADVAARLPKLKAVIDTLPPCTDFKESHSVKVRVGVQGGILGGETNLLAKKIATLVMVLEERLFRKLRVLRDGVHLVNEDSRVAMGPWPQGNVVSSDYDSHIPPMATIKPALWNNLEPETIYRKLSKIWSAPSLEELSHILDMWPPCDAGFYIWPPWELRLRPMPWGIEETPQDPSPRWRGDEELDGHSTKTQWDPEEGYTYFYFTYLRSTFNHTLIYNWVKVIARIVELALAGPDEYKRCLETIFRILHEADQGDDEARQKAWEQLMKHVLKLEDCIPDWRDYISGRYA